MPNRRVFVSHSSRDASIVEAVKHAFSLARLDFEPYFVEDRPTGGPPSKEVVVAVRMSKALFVFFTANSVEADTRDWIVFELGVALSHSLPIFAWRDITAPKDRLPRLLDQVAKYRDFDATTTRGAFDLAQDIVNVVRGLDNSSLRVDAEVEHPPSRRFFEERIRALLSDLSGPIRLACDNPNSRSAMSLADKIRSREEDILGLDPVARKIVPDISAELIELTKLVDKYGSMFGGGGSGMSVDNARAFMHDSQTKELCESLKGNVEKWLASEAGV